ncbi:NAD(P)/FAD-dependent oxidoreductase [Phaeovulum vinaykumarii]|uniref:Glycine/D-amino acid oxidase n=1 Tax=Phaeovulum vinaykumarii TaxID=407234 RepID=A0A1N7JNI6_9RHOB|nr:FAD-dependent oxidoreductase [Phaeovulum vinaykumarii]SIS50875.1 Glycine/D-amino acid oxidase [Phaeovulum vinaykumarii]SOB90468.1 glycine/D-amino acid oxidase-like deaminating enzyme [Phaeovulum vinaykumarii]
MEFPFHDISAVTHRDPLPQAADVVVIGGGVIGVCTALYLARAGERVVLVEKGRIAAEESGRNWGWVRAQGRDAAELPIMLESRRLWADLAAETGNAFGLTRAGVLYPAGSDREMADFARWTALAHTHEMDTTLLDRAALARLMPHRAGWIGGMWTASDLRAEPFLAVPALARLARAAGVTIREHCAARGFSRKAGALSAVVTEAGTISATRAVLAGGAWSSLLLRREGMSIPQLSVIASVLRTAPMTPPFPGAAADHDFALRPRADGGLTLAPGGWHEFHLGPDSFRHLRAYLPQLRANLSGTRLLGPAPAGYPDAVSTPRRWSLDGESPFERMRILNPRPDQNRLGRVLTSFARAFPALGRPQVAETWAGMIDVMPDVVPVVDYAPLPGLVVATGMSGHGFGIGPGMGRVVADLVRGRAPGHDLRRFRWGRFSDGSKLDLGLAL